MKDHNDVISLRSGGYCSAGVKSCDDSICSAEFSEGCKKPADDETNDIYQNS